MHALLFFSDAYGSDTAAVLSTRCLASYMFVNRERLECPQTFQLLLAHCSVAGNADYRPSNQISLFLCCYPFLMDQWFGVQITAQSATRTYGLISSPAAVIL